MSKPLTILISGSGIAGSVFAFWLLRAYPNANITIVERSPALRLTGAGVDIRSSAVDIIKWMGLEAEIRKQTSREAGMQLVHADGSTIATFGTTGRTDVQSLTSEYEIFRGALAKIFIEPILDRVDLIFDDSVDSFEQRDDRVVVTFTKSKEVKTYDLLVAADGCNSKLRGLLLNSPPRDQIYDEGAHVGYFTTKTDLLQGSRLAKGISTTRGRCIWLRPTSEAVGKVSVVLMKVNAKKDIETKDKLNQALLEGNGSFMDLIEEMFGDVGWLAPDILREMRNSDDFYCSPVVQTRSPSLQSGRVVLLGDAGYATPGFGTSLAIIGGYVLAGELARQNLSTNNPGNIASALKAYEDLLKPFVKAQQPAAGTMQFVLPQTQWGVGIRNTVFGLVSMLKLDRVGPVISAMFGISEKKLAMPEYPWVA